MGKGEPGEAGHHESQRLDADAAECQQDDRERSDHRPRRATENVRNRQEEQLDDDEDYARHHIVHYG